MQSEHLSPADHAWLRMDAPSNPMVITAVSTFAEPFPIDELEVFVRERLLPNVRFRQRLAPATRLRGTRWEWDRDFDLRGHVHHVALPRPGDDRALAEMVADLMSTPLDPRRPLWHAHLVDSYEGGSAIIFRLHHAIADGFALVELLRSLSSTPSPPEERPRRAGVHARPHLAEVVPAALSVGRLLLLGPDPRTPLKGKLGATKRVAWSSAMPLPMLKELAHRRDATVSDVFAAVVAGGLRRYLEARVTVGRHLEVRAVVPVNLRGEAEASTLGNRFGLAFLALPLGIESPEERLREIVRRTRALKSSAEPLATFAVLESMALATPGIDDLVVALFQSKATLVLSSLVGPSTSVSLAGRRVRSMVFFAPQAGGLGLGVSIFSYAGEARVGVASDANLVADPAELVGGLEMELAVLRGSGP